MMTTQSQPSNARQSTIIRVEAIYSKNGVNVFRVHIKEGKFIVLDYKDRFGKTPDTEIFWENSTFAVQHYTSQYKAANKKVTEFLKQQKN